MWKICQTICQMKNFTRHLFDDWTKLKTLEECEIVKSYAENSRRFSLIYSCKGSREDETHSVSYWIFFQSMFQCIASQRCSSSCRCLSYRSSSTSYCPSTDHDLCYRRIRATTSWTFGTTSRWFSRILSWPGRSLWLASSRTIACSCVMSNIFAACSPLSGEKTNSERRLYSWKSDKEVVLKWSLIHIGEVDILYESFADSVLNIYFLITITR